MQEKKLFKFHLDVAKQNYEKTPDFFYRTNRWRMETNMRRPMGIAPWYFSNGWIFRGACIYLAYYYLIKRTPYRKSWNRVGYEYESHHKTSKGSY
jgi:hypothetical protein